MRKEAVTIAAAVLAHVLFLGAARSIPAIHRLEKRLARVAALDVEIEAAGADREAGKVAAASTAMAPSPGPEPAAEEPRTTERPAAPLPTEATERPDRAPDETAGGREPDGARAELPLEEPAASRGSSVGEPMGSPDGARAGTSSGSGAPDEYSDPNAPSEGVPSSLAGLVPGLGLSNRIALENAEAKAAPTSAPAQARASADQANEVLSSTLRGHDRDKGIDLPATGVVVGAVSDATRALPVPHNTRASFVVKLGPGGKVEGVRVSASSAGDAASWSSAAKTVAASLSKKQLALGDASKSGATIVVSVTVKHVYPTGSSKGADVKPVCANQIINDLADSLDDKPAAAATGNVPIFTDENGRPCIPVGMAGSADAANIGATKQIQVQTSSKVLVGGRESLPDVKPVNTDPFWVPSSKDGPRPVAPQKMRKYQRDKEKKK